MQERESVDPFAKLKSDGDSLEQQFAERVRETVPSYAKIWSEYVGNDGNENAIPMLGADEAAEQSRAKCWQRLYTIFESLVLCWDIEEELHRLQEIKDFKPYAQNLNLWMAFYSHLGRIHDMVKAFAGELDRPELLKPFVDYWNARHIVLHGPKVPMKWVYNTLAVPSLGDQPKHWNDKMVWQDLKARDFEFIAEEVANILRELENRLDRCIAELRKILPAMYGWKTISWDAVAKKGTSDITEQARANMSVSSSRQPAATEFVIGSGRHISGAKDG